jgi:hypothetical protein
MRFRTAFFEAFPYCYKATASFKNATTATTKHSIDNQTNLLTFLNFEFRRCKNCCCLSPNFVPAANFPKLMGGVMCGGAGNNYCTVCQPQNMQLIS